MYEPNLPRGALASATLHLRNYRARTIPYEEGVVSLAAMGSETRRIEGDKENTSTVPICMGGDLGSVAFSCNLDQASS